MLLKINNTETPTPLTYKVTPLSIKKTVTNSKGDEFVYILNTKYKIDLSWLPMEQAELNALLASVSSDTFTVTFMDETGNYLTKTMRLITDKECDVMDYVKENARWKPFSMTLKEV